MRRLLAVILLFALSGCCAWPFADPAPEPVEVPNPFAPRPLDTAINVEEITYLVENVTVNLRHRKHLYLQHAVSYFYDSVQSLRLEFVCSDVIDLTKARELLVDTVEDLLAALNQDPLISSQFEQYPLTADRLEIYIDYDSFYGLFVDPIRVAWTGMIDGIVSFYYFDLKDPEDDCWHWKKEFYKTTRELVVYRRSAERRYQESQELPAHDVIFGKSRYIPEDAKANP